MGLRINQNIAGLNAQRQLQNNSDALEGSLEKLSSGMRINRASDSPANLIISEQMRAQIAGLKQAVDNSETAVGMVQTTEAAMVEVSNLLVNMRQLAIHAANEGVNDENMLEADQLELENALNTVDRITANAQFGKKKLLDGSTGANGVGIGEGLQFVQAAPETRMRVRSDQRAGARAGARGTPAFFVNGILLSGARPIEAFEKLIQAELARLARQSPR